MKRRDALRELFTPPPATPVAAVPRAPRAEPGPDPAPSSDPAGPALGTEARAKPVRAGALRTMGLTLKEMSADADDAHALREQIQGGHHVIELDPAIIDPSFVADRIPVERDPEFDLFVRSVAESGQQVPILVRPHPDAAGRYQAAYGHRRLRAAAALGRTVRAIIRPLSDVELVVAQGKENGERRDLSFIERATFAAHLEERGFERATIMAALGVDKADLSRLIALAKAVPAEIVRAIGPAPKIGRPRWTALSDAFAARPHEAAEAVQPVLASQAFLAADSDGRFNRVLEALQTRTGSRDDRDYWRDRAGQPLVRVERSAAATRLTVDERLAAGFGGFLLDRLGALHDEFMRAGSHGVSPRPQESRRRGKLNRPQGIESADPAPRVEPNTGGADQT